MPLLYDAFNAVKVDLSAVGTAETRYVVFPTAGYVTGVKGVSDAANGTSDSVVTVATAADNAISTVTFSSTYTAGTVVDGTTPSTTYHYVAAGAALKVSTDGVGDGAGKAEITISFKPTPV